MRARKLKLGVALLSLTLLLTACAPHRLQPQVKLKPVEKLVTTLIEIPESLLVDCPILPLPERGVENIDLAKVAAAKDIQQKQCNNRFDDIREFQRLARKRIESDATDGNPP